MIKFDFDRSIEILERTPNTLECMLSGISEEWLRNNEGIGTWSPYNVLGHLIHNELTDWMPRIKIILSNEEDKTFEPFDRFARLDYYHSVPLEGLLKEFRDLRIGSLNELKNLIVENEILTKTGIHPAFGEVNLKQLISAWVVHDLGHIAQITRTMAKQYTEEVGPWLEYLNILKR